MFNKVFASLSRFKYNGTMKRFFTILVIISSLGSTAVYGNPNQYGTTGLLSIPTADTLDSGNICIGIWGNYSKDSKINSAQDAFIIPASITIGVSPFWEIYGTYPNLLFNDKEEASGRGTADLGTKLRILGKRNSSFKFAADLFLQRHVSQDLTVDGNLDKGARAIASFKKERIGVHAYAGYIFPDAPIGQNYANELIYGGGVEFLPLPRVKLTTEIMGNKNRDRSLGRGKNSTP